MAARARGEAPGQMIPKREEPMGTGKAPRPRRTSQADRWTQRFRILAVALELLIEGWRLLRELLGGWP